MIKIETKINKDKKYQIDVTDGYFWVSFTPDISPDDIDGKMFFNTYIHPSLVSIERAMIEENKQRKPGKERQDKWNEIESIIRSGTEEWQKHVQNGILKTIPTRIYSNEKQN